MYSICKSIRASRSKMATRIGGLLNSFNIANMLNLVAMLFYMTGRQFANGEMFSIAYTQPNDCVKAGQMFDTARLSCQPCAEGQQNAYQVPAFDGLSCICKSRHKLINVTNSGLVCEPCPPNKITSKDGFSCVGCGVPNTFHNITQTCSECGASSTYIDRMPNGTLTDTMCIKCIAGTEPSDGRCKQCSDPLLAIKSSCDCPKSNNEKLDGLCIPNSSSASVADSPRLYIVPYEREELRSSYLCHRLRAVAITCQIYGNSSSCQSLANLCVLLHNSYSDNQPSACSLYMDVLKDSSGSFPPQLSHRLPLLYYRDDSGEEAMLKKEISTQYSFGKTSKTSHLNLTASVTSIDGRFLGLVPITGSSLQLCPGPPQVLDAAFAFGTQYKRSCVLPVRKLWNMETLFYDLYVYYENPGKIPSLFPVPVRNLNYNKNGAFLNRNKQSSWQLTRRFFLVDTQSGRGPCGATSPQLRAIRYARHMTLRVELYEGEVAGRIYPPLLTVEYAEANLNDYESDAKVEVSFHVEYTTDRTDNAKDVAISVGVVSALAVAYSIIQTWSWSKRSGRIAIDISAMVNFLLYTCGNLANVFFAVIFCTSFYNFIFFKRQDAVFVTLPTSEQEATMASYLIAAFVLKSVQVLHMMALQLSFDIFFIDWERPRPKTGSRDDQPEVSGQATSKTSSVSIWRTYFVANEWAELQTLRRAIPAVTLLASIFFLRVVGLENLASSDPWSHTNPSEHEYHAPPNITFRFALAVTTYGVIAAVQWVLRAFAWERYVEDKMQQLEDLCSLSNVSIFIMSTKQFGYYIHGRSAHGNADSDLRTIYEQLHREEENLCSQRGLLPNSDHQTFQMALPLKLRVYYDTVMSVVTQTSQQMRRQFSTRSGNVPTTQLPNNVEKALQAYHTMNRFLSAFIEHALRDLDYVVKDKTFVENLLDVEFQEPIDQGIFYQDNGHSFDALLIRGHEMTFLVFEALLFALVDYGSQSYDLAAICTYFVSKALQFIRQRAGKRALARKTLIDNRFLV